MEILEIQTPVIVVLKSSPSSLGTKNYHMVLFDSVHSSEFDSRLEYLSENIDDEKSYYPFFLLHSTSTCCEPVIPLRKEGADASQFCVNRTDTDSVLRHHCLAYRCEDTRVSLKAGFHSWQASEDIDKRMPNDWETMKNMNGEVHFIVHLQKNGFWAEYLAALKRWIELIKA